MPTPLEFNPAISSEKITAYCQENGCESLVTTSLEALLNRLNHKRVLLSRLKRLSSLSIEEEILLRELNFTVPLVVTLASKATASASSVHDLLAQCDMNEESEEISQIAVTVWVNRFQDLLEGEAQPLAFFVKMRSLLLDTPIVFCALLYYLIERSASIDDIIKSGLLHKYFVIHSFEMSRVEQVYFFLEKNNGNKQAIRLLLDKIKKTGTLYAGLEKYALDGQLKHEELEQVIIVKPVYTRNLDEAYFNKLFQFFGFSLLVLVLRVTHGKAKQYIKNTLTSFSDDDLKQFYHYVNASVPARHRLRSFARMNYYLSDDVVLKLLANDDLPVWSILSSNFSLMSKVDINWIKSKIASLQVDEIEQAFVLSDTEALKSQQLDSLIYRRIAELKLEHPDIFIDDEILCTLQAEDAVQTWLSDKALEYREVITCKMNCLSSGSIEHSYQYLCD